ncbi:hypothetical protein GCM10009733_023780 [Nonomuraea maheshkhaliensis]|uniref:Cupin domain-containing protein n=1 Tax=Nonomuraea maheshkhaliensis TaxID=419590 RepID=A0ABN2F1M2_9ACTN
MTCTPPPIPDQDDPRWTRKDAIFVPRGNRHGFTNTGKLPGRLLTFMLPAGHEQFWLDNGIDPVPGKPAPIWGPEELATLIPELAKHQVTRMPGPNPQAGRPTPDR